MNFPCIVFAHRFLFLNFSIFSFTHGCSNKSKDPEQNENNSTVQGAEKNMSENKVLESKWTRQALPSPSEIANLPKDGGDEFNRLIFKVVPTYSSMPEIQSIGTHGPMKPLIWLKKLIVRSSSR